MQRTNRNRALKRISSSTKSHSITSKSSIDKENIVNESIPKESIPKESIRKEDEELSKIFQNATIRSIEKDEEITSTGRYRYCLPRRSHESVSEFDLERLNRGMIQKPIARIPSAAKDNRDRDDLGVTIAAAAASSSTAVTESIYSKHVFSSIGSAFEPNFPL